MAVQTHISKKPSIILDTNIIIYRSQTWTEKQFKIELVKIENKYNLTISKITKFELLKDNKTGKESKSLKLLQQFASFEITEEVLITSAYLYRIFKDSNKDKNIQDPDVIIAATSFLNITPILTVNRSDFPYPYFEELEVLPIIYNRVPSKTDCMLFCLLKPNIELIKTKIDKIIS